MTETTILGDAVGQPGTYTFTAAYEPVNATPPITFTWDSGELGATSVRTLTVGTHTQTVTATNCADALVLDTHTVVITAPAVCTNVTGVSLTQTTTDTIYPETMTAFSANILPEDAAKPYNYRLSIDGTPGHTMTSSDDPLVFGQTFAAAGSHAVEIAVWNCMMTAVEAVTSAVEIDVETKGYYIYLPTILKRH